MAASVRIEDEAFSDHRYGHLAKLLGLPNASCARGMMADVWRQCTAQQKHVLSEALVDTILGDGGAKAMVDADLGELVADGIRVKGTHNRIEWLGKLRKNAKKGGNAKAAKRQPNGTHPVLPNGSERQVQSSAPFCPPAPAPAPAPALLIREIGDEKKQEADLNEIERLGYPKYGALVGSSLIAIRKLEPPPSRAEIAEAMRTPGTSWKYAVKVIESMRAEAEAKPKPGSEQAAAMSREGRRQRYGPPEPKPVNGSNRKAMEVLAGLPDERSTGGLGSVRDILRGLGHDGDGQAEDDCPAETGSEPATGCQSARGVT